MFKHVVGIQGKIDFNHESRVVKFTPKESTQLHAASSSSSSFHDMIAKEKDNNFELLLLKALNNEKILNFQSKKGIIMKQIGVQGNCIYQIVLDVDILFNKSEELEPKIKIKLTSLNWSHLLLHELTQNVPIVAEQFFVPSFVNMINVELMLDDDFSKDKNFEIHIHSENCNLNPIQNQVQRSWCLSRKQFNQNTMPDITRSPLYTIIQHCYLLHVPSININQTFSVQKQLRNFGLKSQLVFDEKQCDDLQDCLVHDSQICNACFYENITVQNYSYIEDCQTITQCMVQILKQALDKKQNSIMIVRDDVSLHSQWDSQIEIHLKEIPDDWEVMLFGAHHLRHEEKTANNASQWIDKFYSVDDNNICSAFSFALNGTITITKCLEFFQTCLQNQSNAMLIFQEFVNKMFSSNSFVWFPNLMIVNPKESSELKFLELENGQFDNLNIKHPLHWNSFDYKQQESEEREIEYKSKRAVHIFCQARDDKRLEQQIENLNKQTFKNWKLYVFAEEIIEIKNQPSNVYIYDSHHFDWMNQMMNIIETLSLKDWITFARVDHFAVPCRLSVQINAWFCDARLLKTPFLKVGNVEDKKSDIFIACLGSLSGKLHDVAKFDSHSLLASVFSMKRIIEKNAEQLKIMNFDNSISYIAQASSLRLYTVNRILTYYCKKP